MVAIMFATWGVVFLDRMTLLFLAPYIAGDLHLDSGQIGLLAGAVALGWAVSSFVLGAVSDRIGRKRTLVPMIVLFSGISAASAFVHGFRELLLLRALLGIAEGPCWSVMMALVEENSPRDHRGRNVGIVVSAAAVIGLAVAPVLTTQVAAHLGWRSAFLFAGAPGVVLALLIAAFVQEAPPKPVVGSPRRLLAELRELVAYRNLWLSSVGAAGFMSWLFLVNGFGPLYITQVEHQTGTTAGFLMGAAGLGSFILGLAGPALSDRFGRRSMLMVSAGLCVLLPLALLVRPLYGALWGLAAVLFLTQAGQAISAICIVLVPSESVPAHLVGGAIGFATMFGELIGGFLAPLAGGALAERHGLAVPLWMAAAGAVVVLLSALGMRVRTAGALVPAMARGRRSPDNLTGT